MKFKLGFSADEETQVQESAATTVTEGDKCECVRSVVNVTFDCGKTFPYYNDAFNLQKGDSVYVDGKLAGLVGVVTDVTTKFKVDLEHYKRVLAKLDFVFHGEFVKINSLMVSFNSAALPFEQVRDWYIPPKEKEQDFFVGEGYTFDLFGDEANIEQGVYNKAIGLLIDGGLKYLSVADGVGRAVIGTENMHIVEFNYNPETHMLTDIYCDCLAFGFCKHCVAVCIAMNRLIRDEQFDEEKSFCGLDAGVFYEKAIINVKKITL